MFENQSSTGGERGGEPRRKEAVSSFDILERLHRLPPNSIDLIDLMEIDKRALCGIFCSSQPGRVI